MIKFTDTLFWKHYNDLQDYKKWYKMRCVTDAVVLWNFFSENNFQDYLEVAIHEGMTTGILLECNPNIKITGVDISKRSMDTQLFCKLYPNCKRVNFGDGDPEKIGQGWLQFNQSQIDKFTLIRVGSHYPYAVVKYTAECIPLLDHTGVILIDDINNSEIYATKQLLMDSGLLPFLKLQQSELWHYPECNRTKYLDSMFTNVISNFLYIDTYTEFNTTVVQVKSNKFFNDELALTDLVLKHYNI